MRKTLQISERDLFNYIFFKKSIEENKLHLLEKDGSGDNSSLIKKLKECLNENLTFPVKVRINNFVKYYKPVKSITLSLIKETKTDPLSVKLSDETGGMHEISKSTFIDGDNIYMIRLINYECNARIFLFSRDEEKISNCSLILIPGNESFDMINNLLPLEINRRITASGIVLIFN